MKRYIAWDTETSGLPYTQSRCSVENVHAWDDARVASLAMIVFDGSGNELESHYMITQPDGFELGNWINTDCFNPKKCTCCDHKGATHVHKITHEKALNEGVPFKTVYDMFMLMIKKYNINTIVAHNSPFDENMFISECIRYNLSTDIFDSMRKICTVEMSKMNFLPTINNKLPTVYEHLFGGGFLEHHALFDARACGKIYHALEKRRFDVYKPIKVDTIIVHLDDVPQITGQTSKNPDIIAKPIIAYNKIQLQSRREQKYINNLLKNEFLKKILIEQIEKYNKIQVADIPRLLKSIRLKINEKNIINDFDTNTILNYFENILYAKQLKYIDKTKLKTKEKTVYTIRGTKYQISGIVDEMPTNKNKQKLLKRSYLYNQMDETKENIMAQTYMFLLDADECSFDVVNKTVYKKDTKLWNNTLEPNLIKFFSYIHRSLV
jgi:DNA polymerase III epsilon subunit-like protein